jgi:hypothetical protein
MSKWVMNFYNHKVGDEKDIEQLTQKGKLNNGKEINYALGISVDVFKGWKQFSHSGGDAGYRTYLTVFPDLKFGVIAFSNLGDFDPWNKADDIARFFIRDTSTKNVADPPKPDSGNAVLKDTLQFKNYMGDYISDEGVQFTFAMQDQKIYWKPYGQTYLLMKDAKDTFSMVTNPEVKFIFGEREKMATVDQYWPDNKRSLTKFIADTSQTDKQLQAYTGIYYCPELDCKYGIAVKDHHLVLTNNKYNDTRLTMAGADHLLSDYWWMDHLLLLRNSKKEITGFEVNSGRIMHLRFNKIE